MVKYTYASIRISFDIIITKKIPSQFKIILTYKILQQCFTEVPSTTRALMKNIQTK